MKFTGVAELQVQIEDYFANVPTDQQTITGLAVHLDTSRETLMNYQEKDEFFDTIKKAKDRIEHAYEMRGLKVGNAFDIFRLKNMGWKDKQELGYTDNQGNDAPIQIIQLPSNGRDNTQQDAG